MARAHAQRWRARLERANRRLVKAMTRAVRREYAIVAAEVQGGVFDLAKHRARITHVLRTYYTLAFDRFGALGALMLDGTEPLTRADERPESVTPPANAVTRAQIAAVLTAILATAVAEELIGALLEALLEDKRVVAAIGEAIVSEATLAGAIGAASRNPVVVEAVGQAIIAGAVADAPSGGNLPPPAPPPPPTPSPQGGEGGPPGAPAPPPPPPPPPKPPKGGPTGRPSFRERVARWIERHAAERGQQISLGTRDIITAAEARAVREGVNGEVAVANRIAEELTGVRKSTWRARRIARTEVGAAQNAALLEMAAERGKPFTKEWVAIEDERTRPTHTAADGQKIAAEELFTVGGAQLAHPGDPNGPLSEIVNCRCTMLLETVE